MKVLLVCIYNSTYYSDDEKRHSTLFHINFHYAKCAHCLLFRVFVVFFFPLKHVFHHRLRVGLTVAPGNSFSFFLDANAGTYTVHTPVPILITVIVHRANSNLREIDGVVCVCGERAQLELAAIYICGETNAEQIERQI